MLRVVFAFAASVTCLFLPSLLMADGKVVKLQNYKGSLEELAQEAIIVLTRGDANRPAVEDLILKIRVEGETDQFGWIIPFPNEPETFKEDPQLFKELFDYVQQRTRSRNRSKFDSKSDGAKSASENGVEVVSRKVVGDFDITVVRETEAGGLSPWLSKNGFQELQDEDGVLEFYRQKKYVFACIKVTAAALADEKSIESHPLRFRFETGGKDGIYFPMKMTGLQTEPFDVNLYIFSSSWINGELNQFGYRNRGFDLVFRDYDSPQCEANAGKNYSAAATDAYLEPYARQLSTVEEFFQRLYPGRRFYLTNIQSSNLKPDNVRVWTDDLWVFPFYVDRSFVPLDVQDDGPASGAWPGLTSVSLEAGAQQAPAKAIPQQRLLWGGAIVIVVLVLAAIATLIVVRTKGRDELSASDKSKPQS